MTKKMSVNVRLGDEDIKNLKVVRAGLENVNGQLVGSGFAMRAALDMAARNILGDPDIFGVEEEACGRR